MSLIQNESLKNYKIILDNVQKVDDTIIERERIACGLQ